MLTPTASASQLCRWHAFPSVIELEQAAARTILDAARTAIASRGAFRLVLAGGSTPLNVYKLLRGADATWAAWHIYFGDERCLPPDHAERNSRKAQRAWLDHVAIPPQQIHVIPAEQDAQAAADRYARELADVGEFDLVLLGLGEDGHTASLFPGQDWSGATAAALPVHDAPKPPADRVSLSAQRLSHARAVLFLVSGSGKQQAINAWRAGAPIPAAAIRPRNGVDVYLDAALLAAAGTVSP
jgi:6-phosphogluconolactonase